jgi:O-antigen/teichoic acid export membrane protein
MSAFVETHTMGWYSVALNVSGTFLFLPVILSSVIFPVFARTYGTETNTSNRILSKSIDLMFLFGIPIGFGLTSISASIIPLLYGPAFAPATAILALMGPVLVFSYLATVIGQYMVATEKIHIWTIIMVLAVIITIPFDIWLIPLCERMFGNGAIGGAITFLFTEFGMAAAGMFLLPRGMLQWSNVRVAVSTVVVGLCMMGVWSLVQDQFILVPIILGGLTYVSLILLLRVVPREDITMLTDVVRGLITRIRKRSLKPNSPSEA